MKKTIIFEENVPTGLNIRQSVTSQFVSDEDIEMIKDIKNTPQTIRTNKPGKKSCSVSADTTERVIPGIK